MNSLLLAAVIATMPLPEGKVKLYEDSKTCTKGKYVELVSPQERIVDKGCWWYSDDGSKVIVKWDSVKPEIYYGKKWIKYTNLALASSAVFGLLMSSGSSDKDDKPVSP